MSDAGTFGIPIELQTIPGRVFFPFYKGSGIVEKLSHNLLHG